MADFRQLWVDKLKETGGSHVKFSQLSILALMQLTAIVGVDIGMTPKQFTDVAAASYNEAHRRAPKFS